MTSVGTALPPLRIESVSAELMHDMAVILDDPNEIHLDVAVVAALGLGDRTINQGPTNCGYLMNLVREAFPEGFLASFKARFLGNVFARDSLVAEGVVREASPDGTLVTCELWLDRDGARLLEATATVRLPEGAQIP